MRRSPGSGKPTGDNAKKLAEDNKDKIGEGVDKATDVADAKTGGKHTEHLDKVDDAAAKFSGED